MHTEQSRNKINVAECTKISFCVANLKIRWVNTFISHFIFVEISATKVTPSVL